jgi:hypothetical protein
MTMEAKQTKRKRKRQDKKNSSDSSSTATFRWLTILYKLASGLQIVEEGPELPW